MQPAGLPRGTVYAWLVSEAAILGAIAALVGLAVGTPLGRLAVAPFGDLATLWTRIPVEVANPTGSTLVAAFGLGLATAMLATLVPIRSLATQPMAALLHLVPTTQWSRHHLVEGMFAPCAGLAAAALLVLLSPRTLPFGWLVAYIFGIQLLIMVSFALLAPAMAVVIGSMGSAVAERLRGALPLLLSARSVAGNPYTSVIAVAAIVAALSTTLCNAALAASCRESWVRWIDPRYDGDIRVSAAGPIMTIVDALPLSEDIVAHLRTLPGVVTVQGRRRLTLPYAQRAVIVRAIDPTGHGLPLTDGDWEDISTQFQDGAGIVVTENLARRVGIDKHDSFSLPTAAGERTFTVLGVAEDLTGGGDLGAVTLVRPLFKTLWRDDLVDNVRIWTAPGTDNVALATMIERQLGPTHGIRAVRTVDARALVVGVADSAFGLSYALIFLGLVISFLGVTNLLIAQVLERQRELRTLHAVGLEPSQVAGALLCEGALIGTIVMAALAGLLPARRAIARPIQQGVRA